MTWIPKKPFNYNNNLTNTSLEIHNLLIPVSSKHNSSYVQINQRLFVTFFQFLHLGEKLSYPTETKTQLFGKGFKVRKVERKRGIGWPRARWIDWLQQQWKHSWKSWTTSKRQITWGKEIIMVWWQVITKHYFSN